MDENARRALRHVTAAAHTAIQPPQQDLYLPNRWPNTYSADFVRNHPTLLPAEIRAEIEGRPLLARVDAADAVRRWAEAINVPPEAIKAIFADAYLTEQGIPLGAADKERALYAQFTEAATKRPPGTRSMKWCPECGLDDWADDVAFRGPRHFAPDPATPLYREEGGSKVPNTCPGTPITLSYEVRRAVPAPTPLGGNNDTHH